MNFSALFSKTTKVLLFFLITVHSFVSFSQINEEPTQNLFKGKTNEKVRTRFNKPIIELKKGSLISNVLKVVNNSNENLNFTVDVLLPTNWSSVLDTEKIYNVAVLDTVVIPILVVPSKIDSGNSEIIINTFLIDLDGQQIGDNSFTLKTKKKVSWDVVVKSANRFYFKNDEYNKKFDYSIINKGNYKQDIFVNHLFPKKDLFLADTTNAEKKIKDPNKTISLSVGEETEMSYYATAVKVDKRNKRKVSINNYKPFTNDIYKKYGLVINSSEPKNFGKNIYKKANKVSFIKLPNELELQPYGYPSVPLTVEINVQNLLNDYPFMSMNMRGFKQLTSSSNLVYSAELNYTQSYFSNQLFQDVPWYIGYFDDRTSVEIGQVSADIIGISSFGRGARGSYRINDNHRVGAFYLGARGLLANADSRSFGASHFFNINNNIKLTSRVGRNENNISGRNTTIVSVQPQIKFNRKNNANFQLAHSTHDFHNLEKKNGYLFSFGVGSAITKDLRLNFNGRYNDKNFSGGNFERLNFSHRTNYAINNRWNTYITNSYQSLKTDAIQSANREQVLFFNNFIFSRKMPKGSIQPGLYYDYRNFLAQKIHSRGLSFRTSTYDYGRNFISSIFVRAGYTKAYLDEPTEDFFSFEFSSLTRYKVWNFTTRYNYGTFATNSVQNLGGDIVVPQFLRLSLQNQYVFKNKSIVLESSINYNYRNLSKNNSLGIYPELYYFTKTGWRFSLRAGYSFNSVDYTDLLNFEDQLNFSTNRNGKSENSNLNIGFSIRKEFGIPIPFLKKKSSNIAFVSFLDLNGNGLKDDDETSLKNVVVRLGKHEVLTSEKGVAKLYKTPNDKYELDVYNLEKLEGWFPNIPDSLDVAYDKIHYLPFVRGVKIYGDVILDRQKIAITDEKPIDLSRIKITATKDVVYNTLTDKNGHFEFYLPNGRYTLTMDESILSDNLRLSRNNIPINLKNNQDGVYVSFYILEKRRKVIIRDFSKKKR